ncbi:MAG: HAMP domain-containing sensor histidine kinase [Pseudomonadota bacterium]|nr:HAMP domain-containing sensor histidine kinase [Pseudomonadota bacterium]
MKSDTDTTGKQTRAPLALERRLQAAESQLHALQKQQQALVFGISHDLRAPLRAIEGFALRLQQGLQAQDTALVERSIEQIHHAAARSGALIDALLEYSRVGRATLKYQPVALDFLVDWVVMDLSALWPQLEVGLDIQPGLQVCGDESLLKTLLLKVLENSWKFSAGKGRVDVCIRGENTPGGLHVEIRDQGIGMELRDAGQPFEPFQRLHSTKQGAGDGLGLAIAQTIVARHGGQIWVESSPGKGCSIHLLLPGHEGQSAPAVDL